MKEELEILEKTIQKDPQLFKLAGYNHGKQVHQKQLEFHKCMKRNRWVFGGNRTGKTECGAVEAVWFARGIHPYRQIKGPTCGWVVSLTQEVQRDVAQKKLLSYLPPQWIERIVMRKGTADSPESGIIDFIQVKSKGGGNSVIGFKSCDQGRAKFQGTSLDYVWFDEEPPKDIYDECRMRILDRRGDIWGTMTPLMGLTWVHEDIYMNRRSDPEVWYEQMAWRDNPFLDASELSLLESVLSDEERQSRQYGHFASSCGLVYPEFSMENNVIDPFDVPAQWYSAISIDPGLVNPLSAHWYAVDGDGNIFVIAEHYAAGMDAAEHCRRIREISERLGWPKDSSGCYEALMDSASLQQTLASPRSVAQIFSELGIRVNARVDKNVWAGVQKVKQYLKGGEGRTKLYIFSSCPEMIREIKGYRYGDGDKPVKRNDHAMDELRYFIMSRPAPYKPENEVHSEVVKDLERMMRRRRERRY